MMRMTGTRLDILTRNRRSVTILDFRGRLTTGSSANLLVNTVRDLVHEGELRIILNFECLEFMDSTGLGSVVTVAEQLRRQGGRLCILHAHDPVRNLLQITRLDSVLPNFQDEDAAVESLDR
jgi:anti-anti-sigma factor